MNQLRYDCVTDIKEELLIMDDKMLSLQTVLMNVCPTNNFAQLAEARLRNMRREMTWCKQYVDELLKSLEKQLPQQEPREG